MHVSLLGISGALYLSGFEQPASMVFFRILLEHFIPGDALSKPFPIFI
jgi:hypothetical protein